jgi:type IV secretion system protein TrbI
MKPIESPAGLDISPLPPSPMRIGKKPGIVGIVILTVAVGLVIYGIYRRNQSAIQAAFTGPDDGKRVTAATEAGKLIASEIPSRVKGERAVSRASDELELEPEPARRLTAPPPAYPAPPIPPPAAPAYREASPEEKRQALERQRELAAMDAATSTHAASSGTTANAMPSGGGDLAQLLQGLQGGRAPAIQLPSRVTIGGAEPNQAEEYEQQNMQDQKEAFLAKARSQPGDNYLASMRTRPLSRYEIKAGWDIPAVLEQAINSDLPGEMKALVRENVYDTATGRHLLIPQGARLTGAYDSRVSYGQDGVQVAWNRIIFPDGSSINLEGMAGQDAQGYAGLRHDVDHHYKRLLGFGVLTSLFSASFQLSQSRRGGLLGLPSAGEVAGTGIGRDLSRLGADVTRRNLNVQPTIKVPIGYRFNVRVNRDIVFEEEYRLSAL